MDRQVVTVAAIFSIAGALALQRADTPQPASTEQLSACPFAEVPAAPVEPDSPQARKRAAAAIVSLVNHWDDATFAELRGGSSKGLRLWREQAALIRTRLGECGPPQLFVENPKRSRFFADCERGRMEVAPQLDDSGRVKFAYWGAQSAEPGPGVREAADALLVLKANWDPQFAAHLFSPEYDLGALSTQLSSEHERLGECSTAAVDLAGARGAIFVLQCEYGSRSMKVSLDSQQKVRLAKFWPVRTSRPGEGE